MKLHKNENKCSKPPSHTASTLGWCLIREVFTAPSTRTNSIQTEDKTMQSGHVRHAEVSDCDTHGRTRTASNEQSCQCNHVRCNQVGHVRHSEVSDCDTYGRYHENCRQREELSCVCLDLSVKFLDVDTQKSSQTVLTSSNLCNVFVISARQADAHRWMARLRW